MPESNSKLPFSDPLTLFGVSAAMHAAGSTGILKHVVESPCTASQCARALGLTEYAVAVVLEILTALGLLEKNGDTFGIPLAALPSKLRSGEALLGLYQHFGTTVPLLQKGDATLWLDGTATQREATYGQWAAGMGELFQDAAVYLAGHLDAQPEQILDVGCGSGVWSLEIAARLPQAQVTGLDLPSVLDAFSARAAKMGLQERTTCMPGDMWQIELAPERYDLVMIANVLRLEPAEKAELLVARVAASLRRGGTMVIVDALAGGSPSRELARSVYALHLGLRTRLGRVHSPTEIRAWLAAAGVPDIKTIDCGLQIAAIGAMIGRKDLSLGGR